jgi:cysteine sulfinate desulfinase/cysteine desulfurase-like protein
MTKIEMTARSKLLQAMTLPGLEELSQTIRVSLDHADRTAETLRCWLRMVEDELQRKAGF